jgi:hypothetical protein
MAMTPISFNVAKEDVLAMTCHYYATSATVRSTRLKSQVAVGLILAGAVLLALIGTGQKSGSGVVGVVLLVCAGVSVGCVPSWYRRGVRRSAEKMLEESSYRKAFGAYILALGEDGLTSKSPTGEGKYRWDAVNAAVLTPEHLFIFLVGAQGFAIPRSQVSDPVVQEVKAFVESHIRRTEPDAAPNGGRAMRPRNSGAGDRPPSVS